MAPISISCVVGARPNFMKIAPILTALKARPQFEPWLVHTGQHSSPEMAESFFRDLNIPEPEENLGISGGTSNEQTARVMLALETLYRRRRPSLVLVVGDVNATIAAALTAAKAGIPVAHVEAGLRSFDRTMPEEINRVVTDSVSDYLFTSEPSGEENLLREGVSKDRIFFCGNVMIDTLLRSRERANQSDALDRLGLESRNYIAVTLHRPANVDDPKTLQQYLGILDQLAERIPVVFPMHPRTRNTIDNNGLQVGRVRIVPPQGYIDFLRITAEARLVLTDSGGIQEETTILGVPCLTVRDNTERPVTLTQGTNRLVGTNPAAALQAALEVLDQPRSSTPRHPEKWDGRAAERIADTLGKLLTNQT